MNTKSNKSPGHTNGALAFRSAAFGIAVVGLLAVVTIMAYAFLRENHAAMLVVIGGMAWGSLLATRGLSALPDYSDLKSTNEIRMLRGR